MIDITNLTDTDVGRGVVYIPRTDQPGDGVITSWNDTFIFVRYRGSEQPQATRPVDLEWVPCKRCGEKPRPGETQHSCWYCNARLCVHCWAEHGHCGHPEAEAP
jgi:hypothetical protein